MKYCRHCDTDKPLTGFAKNKYSKDGHVNMCKCCKSEHELCRDHAAAGINDLLSKWGLA